MSSCACAIALLLFAVGDVVEALEMSESDFELKYGREKPSCDGDGIIIHCMGGIRSRRVLDAVHELGYSR